MQAAVSYYFTQIVKMDISLKQACIINVWASCTVTLQRKKKKPLYVLIKVGQVMFHVV